MAEVFQPEGNYYDKYGSKNPVIRIMMSNFFRALDNMLENSRITARGGYCLEAGCGEGNVTQHVSEWIKDAGGVVRFTAFDISEKLIEENHTKYPKITFFAHNIYEKIEDSFLPQGEECNLIICSEVLEHLDQPEKAVINLMNYSDRFIFSVPHEPIWRILNLVRGKYIKDLGNTPGHIRHFSVKAFIAMLEECGLNVKSVYKPLPWIMVYCEKDS